MDQIKRNIEVLTNEELVNQILHHKNEFTEDALKLFQEEIAKRGLLVTPQEKKVDYSVAQLDEKDFILFDHSFNKIELEIALTVLQENRIIFYIGNPSSSDIIPVEREADRLFYLYIHNKKIDEAHLVLDELFDKVDGKYLLKNRSLIDRLKLISFHHIQLSEEDAKESVEVEFSKEEKSFIVSQGIKIAEEADTIEKELDRVIFYYDLIEEVTNKLSNGETNSFLKTELLTVLEIIQLSGWMNILPPFMEGATEALLGLFIQE